ncbi:SnoaL-like domain-containing protein [Sphingomonas zeae]|uniref:SnoaL-like domain-containing protein n=2 Tax=Sphingomonadaceae TaxID=41297 RepID=A0A7Y6B2S9_9SPHN|nr:SnoaL-like domain-containing protein [Sphingomonas zeae]
MNRSNLDIAQNLLMQIGSGALPEAIAAEMDEAVVLEIPGDEGAMPWIGRRSGRQAVADFIADQRSLLTSNMFRVDDILVSERRAVVIGALSATLKANGRTIETDFAIVLTIANGMITRFQMLEDSYAVSAAAR